MTEDCLRQERTAVFLATLLGFIGVDQFYAHHWAFAVFKLITIRGFGTWWVVDIVL
jgi:TM2 domain-containing membrane protein YozV